MNTPFNIAHAVALLSGLLTFGSANAATVSLTPDSEIRIGEEFSLTLTMDFTDEPTLGGGIDIAWDPALFSLVSWEVIPFGDPGFSREGDINQEAGYIDGFAFGDFDGLEGPADLAVATFVADQFGLSDILARPDAFAGSNVAGCFVSLEDFQCQSVSFQDASVSVVPVPGALWLALGAISVLGGFRRDPRGR